MTEPTCKEENHAKTNPSPPTEGLHSTATVHEKIYAERHRVLDLLYNMLKYPHRFVDRQTEDRVMDFIEDEGLVPLEFLHGRVKEFAGYPYPFLQHCLKHIDSDQDHCKNFVTSSDLSKVGLQLDSKRFETDPYGYFSSASKEEASTSTLGRDVMPVVFRHGKFYADNEYKQYQSHRRRNDCLLTNQIYDFATSSSKGLGRSSFNRYDREMAHKRLHEVLGLQAEVSKLKPGHLSDTLMIALGIGHIVAEPPYYANMRKHGYPPGYLRKLRVCIEGQQMEEDEEDKRSNMPDLMLYANEEDYDKEDPGTEEAELISVTIPSFNAISENHTYTPTVFYPGLYHETHSEFDGSSVYYNEQYPQYSYGNDEYYLGQLNQSHDYYLPSDYPLEYLAPPSKADRQESSPVHEFLLRDSIEIGSVKNHIIEDNTSEDMVIDVSDDEE